MKSIFLLLLIVLLMQPAAISQNWPEKAPVDSSFRISQDELKEMAENGIVLPPVKPADNPWLNLKSDQGREFPLVYDMRQTPWLTSVKTQSNGGCWAYSVMGTVESRLLMLGKGYFNLSDNNLKICHKYIPERNTNGNHWMATSYFARRSGPFLETEDPFPGGTTGPENCPDDLIPSFYIHQARYTPPLDRDFTKQTILNTGPVWTLMYFNASYFNSTNATYFYGGNNQVNHAGVIVGWNDTLQTAGGTGAWIVKNTYGPSWGEGGYYYVSYFDTQFLKYNGYWPAVMEHDTGAYLYQYDEIGGYWGVGFNNGVGYGLVKFEGAEGVTEIKKIGTFVQYAGSGVSIKIYDSFNGSLSGLLLSKDEVICNLPGYYTFDLDSSLYIPEGKTFYVQIGYDSKNPNNKWPISIEDTIATYSRPHIETGKFWIAPNPEIWPAAWYQVGVGTPYKYDLCIKAYSDQMPMPPAPFAFAGVTDTLVEGEPFVTGSALADNFTSIQWTSEGNGTFVVDTLLSTTYIPGNQDIDDGFARIVLHVTGLPPLYPVATDTLEISILRYPLVNLIFPQHKEKLCDYELTITGAASDPDGDLIAVEVNLNGEGWISAGSGGTWSATVTLLPGINTVQARAKDAASLVMALDEIEVICSLQNLFLPEGWSVISGFLLPDEPQVEIMFGSVSDNLVVLQNVGGMYAPPPINVNTIGNWNSSSGYKLKMITDDELPFCGDLPGNNHLELAAGYHILPYLSNQPASIQELFTNPDTDILYLFDLYNGLIYWPMGGIYTLSTLWPGQGYQAWFLNPVTVYFPDYQSFFFSQKSSKSNSGKDFPWKVKSTGIIHFFSIGRQAQTTLNRGVLGVFDAQGNCIGMSPIDLDNNGNILLVGYGDDETTAEKDGAEEGDALSFRFFDEENEKEHVLMPEYDPFMPDAEGVFVAGGMTAVTGFQMFPSAFGERIKPHEFDIFPNPSDGSATTIATPGCLNLKICTMDGRIFHQHQFDPGQNTHQFQNLKKGVYLVQVEWNAGKAYKKLIVR